VNIGASLIYTALATVEMRHLYASKENNSFRISYMSGDVFFSRIDRKCFWNPYLSSLYFVVIAMSGCGNGPAPPTITAQPTAIAVNTGASARFEVGVSGSTPFTYQWTKAQNGVAVTIPGATASRYSTPAMSVGDSGATFSVKVTNSSGSVVSNTAALTVLQPAGWDVLTYHNDNARSGQNLFETALTPATVNQTHFGKIAFYATDGKIDAQPLIVSNLPVGNVGRNVLYVATEHDTVYAFDADSGAQIWTSSMLLSGETPDGTHSCNSIVPEIGVTSTPVIDRNLGVIYVVAASNGGNNVYQRLHALSLTTGQEMLGGPTTISATYSDPAVGSTLEFDGGTYVERAALLLANGKIYTSWSSHCDNQPYASWVIVLDASTLQVTHTFNAEPSGTGQASFWNSGAGPNADAAGNVYLLSANGLFGTTLDASGFPANRSYGNSFIKLAPPAQDSNKLTLTDYFSMFDTLSESNGDLDLGSGGGLLLPDLTDGNGQVRHLILGGGKDSEIYVVDRDNMGKYNASDNSQIWQELENAFPNSTNGLYGCPAYFNNRVYFGPTGDAIHAYTITAAKLSSTSAMQTTNTFPYPGVTSSISANGTLNGIVWAIENSATQGVLHAFDANNLSTEMYNSNQAGTRDAFGPGSKFNPPTVANGKVYVTTQVDLTNNPTGAKEGVAVYGAL
jgi:hypothetical protein